ncbi:ABC transporter ATP-binding protein [Streptomyces violaceus]|uniref:ABC transporter ATP-binding protein n=1 Tax=Streptomyces violaceus TaxID=1936 RepID=UPI002E2B0A84|nr:ABC transporter ATP-binding protein [Streptomyces violaceus]
MNPRPRTGQLMAQLIDVSVRRGGKQILDGISLTIDCGRVLALLGRSGAGKSTLLQVLTGDLAPSEGEIDSGGHDLKKGTVHQAPLLFPWLTVRENAGLGQTYAANRDVPDRLVDELLDLLGLTAMADSYAEQISGGQAQRVALARALAIAPDVLLLDEPFSALDPLTRTELQTWLRRQVTERGWTTVMVTHDIDEALVLADQIVLLDTGGRIANRWTNHPEQHDGPPGRSTRRAALRAEIQAAYHTADKEPAHV